MADINNNDTNLNNSLSTKSQTLSSYTSDSGLKYTSVYTYFDLYNDIVDNISWKVQTGIFSNNAGEISSFFTSSTDTLLSSSNYYVSIYQADPSHDTASVQFDITYGNVIGYDPTTAERDDYCTLYDPAKSTYLQYGNLLLPYDESRFQFADGTTGSGDFFSIAFKRERYKNALTKKRWELSITSGSNTITLIDNSTEVPLTQPTVGAGVGNAYYVCSGSIANGIYGTVSDYPYGLYFPELGSIMINSSASMADLGDTTNYSSSAHLLEPSNVTERFLELASSGSNFQAQNDEKTSSTIYYVRARTIENNKAYFSNNPTWQTGSLGVIKHEEV